MNDNVAEGWDGVDRRAHNDDIMLERRLGHIETSIAVVATEVKNLTNSFDDLSEELREVSKPKRNWAEWAGVAVSTVATVALAIGLYVAPLYNDLEEQKLDDIRQWERLNEIEKIVDQRAGVVEEYRDHLVRYHGAES